MTAAAPGGHRGSLRQALAELRPVVDPAGHAQHQDARRDGDGAQLESGNHLDAKPRTGLTPLEQRRPARRQRPPLPAALSVDVLDLNAATLRRTASSAVIRVTL